MACEMSPNSSTVLSRTAEMPETTPTVNREVSSVHSNDSTPSSSCHIFIRKLFTDELLRSCCSPLPARPETFRWSGPRLIKVKPSFRVNRSYRPVYYHWQNPYQTQNMRE